jgi:hypothetical protein
MNMCWKLEPGGIPVHTGWMVEGMWVALALNDFAEAHLARNDGSIKSKVTKNIDLR